MHFQQNSISVGQNIEAKTQQYPNRYFRIVKPLGKGGEGEVYQAEPFNWMSNQQGHVALKFQYNQQLESEMQFIRNIMDYQAKYETPQADEIQQSGIIKIYDIFKWQQYQIVVMEVGSTDLYQYIQSINNNEQLGILKQISLSIRFLHHNKHLHRDLKPENYIRIGNVFKLIDFGLTKQQNICMTVCVGTPLFQAPEVANGSEQYSTSADIWSLGCVFFEVMTKQPLFQTDNQQQLLQQLKDHMINTSIIFNRVDQFVTNQNIKQIIKEMLHPIPDRRIQIGEIIKRLTLIPTISTIPSKSPIPVSFPAPPPQTISNWQFPSQSIQQNQQDKFDQYFKGLNDKLDKFSLDIDQKIENKTNSLLQNILMQQDANFKNILQQSQMTSERVSSLNVKQEELKYQLQTFDENNSKQAKIILENMNQINQNNKHQSFNESLIDQFQFISEPLNKDIDKINQQQIQTFNKIQELIEKQNEQQINLQNQFIDKQFNQEYEKIKLIMNQNQTNIEKLISSNIGQKLLDLNSQNQIQQKELFEKLDQTNFDQLKIEIELNKVQQQLIDILKSQNEDKQSQKNSEFRQLDEKLTTLKQLLQDQNRDGTLSQITQQNEKQLELLDDQLSNNQQLVKFNQEQFDKLNYQLNENQKTLTSLIQDQKKNGILNNQQLKNPNLEQYDKLQQQINENFKSLTKLIQDQNKNGTLNEIIQQNNKQLQLLFNQFRNNLEQKNPNQEQFDQILQQMNQNQQQLLQSIKNQNSSQIINDQLQLIKQQNQEKFNQILKQINEIQQNMNEEPRNRNITEEYYQQIKQFNQQISELKKLINESQLNHEQKQNLVNLDINSKQINQTLNQIQDEKIEKNSNQIEQIRNFNNIQIEPKNLVNLNKTQNAKAIDQKNLLETRNDKQQQDNKNKQVDQLNRVEKPQQPEQQKEIRPQSRDIRDIIKQNNIQPTFQAQQLIKQEQIKQATNDKSPYKNAAYLEKDLYKNKQDGQEIPATNYYELQKKSYLDLNKNQYKQYEGNLDSQKPVNKIEGQQGSGQKESQQRMQSPNQIPQNNYQNLYKSQYNYNPANQFNYRRS